MWLIQDSNWKGRVLWKLFGGLATILQNWISCNEQKMREAHITRRGTSFYLLVFIEKIINRKIEHSLFVSQKGENIRAGRIRDSRRAAPHQSGNYPLRKLSSPDALMNGDIFYCMMTGKPIRAGRSLQGCESVSPPSGNPIRAGRSGCPFTCRPPPPPSPQRLLWAAPSCAGCPEERNSD